MTAQSKRTSDTSLDPERVTEYRIRQLSGTLTKCSSLPHRVHRGFWQLRALPPLPEWKTGKRGPRLIDVKRLKRYLKEVKSCLPAPPSRLEKLLWATWERMFGKLPPDE